METLVTAGGGVMLAIGVGHCARARAHIHTHAYRHAYMHTPPLQNLLVSGVCSGPASSDDTGCEDAGQPYASALLRSTSGSLSADGGGMGVGSAAAYSSGGGGGGVTAYSSGGGGGGAGGGRGGGGGGGGGELDAMSAQLPFEAKVDHLLHVFEVGLNFENFEILGSYFG